jgi:hypothetical protein
VFHYIAAVKSFIGPNDEPFEEKTVSKAPRRAAGSRQRQLDFPSNRLEQSRVPSVVYATPPSEGGAAMTDKRNLNEERQSERPRPDLGQKEAALEKTSEEQLSHMEGGKAAEAAKKRKATLSRDK